MFVLGNEVYCCLGDVVDTVIAPLTLMVKVVTIKHPCCIFAPHIRAETV